MVDSEKLLQDKLLNVKSMNLELVRLEREREVVVKKRNEASNGYIEAEHQRTQMRLKFEREQAERDEER